MAAVAEWSVYLLDKHQGAHHKSEKELGGKLSMQAELLNCITYIHIMRMIYEDFIIQA